MGHSMRAPRGITLLEAMTVCAVVGILTALAVDSWSVAVQRARADDAVLGVYGQLLTARKLARTHNQPVRLALVVDGGTAQARWERHPCDNESFGVGCPSSSCATTTACGPGCACRDSGNWVNVPASVDLTSWGGLCFVGGSGQAIPRVSGTGDCLSVPPPGQVLLRATVAHEPDRMLLLEPVSGQPRLLSCGATDGGCSG